MAFVDYYKILGVDKNIPQEDVKKAYLKRAKQFHPDLHPNDPKAKAKFQALNEAYEVIGDPEKRKKYDQYGEKWRDADFMGQSGYGGNYSGSPFDGIDFGSFAGNGHFSSFFEELFGGMKGHSAETVVKDTSATVSIDMYTAILGGEVVLDIGGGSKIKLKVKPYTQNGSKVRLKGKGRTLANGRKGDLIITYQVTLPTSLTDKQKQLLQMMRNS